MISRILRMLPLSLGAAVWIACTVLLVVNLLLPALGQGRMKLSPPLAGVTNPEEAHLSWAALLDGSFQSAYAHMVGSEMPLYASAVRLRNQVQYSLFGESAVPELLVGRGPSLFETPYSVEYCSRNLATWHAQSDAWAAQIRQMQDIEERRGHAFLYVLTPSKVSQYPDILPRSYTCPSTAADRAGIIPAWLATLRAEGVHVADTTAVMTAAHGAYPFKLFPMGGAHWNAVGSALSIQAVMAELRRLVPHGGFLPYSFTWHMIRHPFGLDIDLSNLLNLIWHFPTAPVPVIDLQPAPPPTPCPDTKVVIVGGSFSHAILETLQKATCNPPAIEYEYWRTYTLYWTKPGPVLKYGVDEAQRSRDILAADVLIYEENEQVLPHPPQGEALYEFLKNDVAQSSSPSPAGERGPG